MQHVYHTYSVCSGWTLCQDCCDGQKANANAETAECRVRLGHPQQSLGNTKHMMARSLHFHTIVMMCCVMRCSGNWRRKWGPSVLLAAAVPLVTADPTRHVLQGASFHLTLHSAAGKLFEQCSP